MGLLGKKQSEIEKKINKLGRKERRRLENLILKHCATIFEVTPVKKLETRFITRTVSKPDGWIREGGFLPNRPHAIIELDEVDLEDIWELFMSGATAGDDS